MTLGFRPERKFCLVYWNTVKLTAGSLRKNFPVLIMAFILTGLFFLYRATAKPISILVDGEERILRTHARTVGAAIGSSDIELHEGDRIFPDGSQSLTAGEVIEIRRSETIQVEIGEETREIHTASSRIGNILADASIELFPADRIWVDGIPVSDLSPPKALQPKYIRLAPAQEISLVVDGVLFDIQTAASTVGEALAEAGIALYAADHISPSPATAIEGISEITIQRARRVNVHVDGDVIESRAAAGTVGEALAQLGIALEGSDYAVPDQGQPLPESGEIQIVRVREEILLEQTPLPFTTEYQPDPDLEIDQQSFVDPGSYGIIATRVRVRYEDGVEVDRAVEDEWVAHEPDPRTIGYGTNIVVRTTGTLDGPIEYWRAIRMYATSYSPSRAGVPDDYVDFGITACGKKLVKGLVAIDRNYIPFHTMMYVPGYGFAEACDTGGGVRGRWIDLGYEDDNYQPWHQYVTVYFLTPIPPASSIAWIFP